MNSGLYFRVWDLRTFLANLSMLPPTSDFAAEKATPSLSKVSGFGSRVKGLSFKVEGFRV
jgi:hypothetical protein